MQKLFDIFLAAIFIALFCGTISACPLCSREVNENIYNADFFSDLYLLLLPVAIIFGLGIFFM